jgi:heme/copper-type cytochrome/quinol oxidase subunit 2
MENYFVRIVAAVLGSGNPGGGQRFELLDRLFHTRLAQSISAPDSETDSSTTVYRGELTLAVKGSGYEPRTLRAPADTPIKMNLVTKDTILFAGIHHP